MNRKIQKGGLVVAATMALLAVSAGSATGKEFHAENSHTVWTGAQGFFNKEGEDTYTFKAGTVKCTSITYQGGTTTAQTGLTTLSLAPSFGECTAFGFVNASIDVNDCKYQYHIEPSSFAIVCPAGQSMIVTAFSCTVTIPAQSGLSGVSYATKGTGKNRDIEITHSISGLKYSQTLKTFPGCNSGNGSFADGTFSGATTVVGRDTFEGEAGVFVEEPPPPKDEIHSEAAHTLWSAAQVGEDAYTFESGTWKCSSRTYSGTSTTATSTTVDLAPSFSGCPEGTAVDANGCAYRYHTKEKGSNKLDMNIVCPEGKAIVITASNCHVTIPAQTGLSSITYANEGSGKTQDVKITHSVTGLKYSQEPKIFPGCTKGSFTNGTYSGSTTLKGINTSSEQVGVGIGESDPPGDEVHSEAAHTLWTATQVGEDTYVFTGGSWKCSSRTYAGTATVATGTTISLTPSFSGCIESTTVDVNGCEYRYHTAKEGVSSQGMSIVCPEGKSIVITAPTCHLTIPPQSGLSAVSYTNEGTGKTRDIKISHLLGSLKYSQEPTKFPGCAKGNFTNGTYAGTTTLKATNTAGEQIGAWVK